MQRLIELIPADALISLAGDDPEVGAVDLVTRYIKGLQSKVKKLEGDAFNAMEFDEDFIAERNELREQVTHYRNLYQRERNLADRRAHEIEQLKWKVNGYVDIIG